MGLVVLLAGLVSVVERLELMLDDGAVLVLAVVQLWILGPTFYEKASALCITAALERYSYW